MNLQQRIQLHRLKRKPIQTIVLNDDLNLDGDDSNVQQRYILIDSDQEYRKLKSEIHTSQQPESLQQKTIQVTDPIRPKFEIECDNEPLRYPSKSQSIIPVINHLAINPFLQVQNKIQEQSKIDVVKQATIDKNKTMQQHTPIQIAYDQFKLLKFKEAQELKKKYQIEQEKERLFIQKQQLTNAPITKQANESITTYITRMVELLNKQNKKRSINKRKNTTEEQAENTNDNDFIEGIGPQIQKPTVLLNFDVLYKTGKIIKYALQQPNAAEYNPMLALVKGRHAKAFIFNEEDFKDGPYGQKPRKIPKLPFPKHRLSLQPWEYYGVSPVEYFSTKNPYHAYKGKYATQPDIYKQLPKPKSEPRYYSYDVDSLLGKRYSMKQNTIQYQAAFIGYKQKHWTYLSHLQIKCPQAILNYELSERNRLYQIILNLKVKRVMRSYQYCILSHSFIKGHMILPKIVYFKKQSKGDQTRITNLEIQRPVWQQSEHVQLQLSEQESENNKRQSKQNRLMEEEWNPDRDLSPRPSKNSVTENRLKNHINDSNNRQLEKKQRKSVKLSQRLSKSIEAYYDDTPPSNEQFEILISPRSDFQVSRREAQQTSQKVLTQSSQHRIRKSIIQTFQNQLDSNSDSPVNRQLIKEDMSSYRGQFE